MRGTRNILACLIAAAALAGCAFDGGYGSRSGGYGYNSGYNDNGGYYSSYGNGYSGGYYPYGYGVTPGYGYGGAAFYGYGGGGGYGYGGGGGCYPAQVLGPYGPQLVQICQ